MELNSFGGSWPIAGVLDSVSAVPSAVGTQLVSPIHLPIYIS